MCEGRRDNTKQFLNFLTKTALSEVQIKSSLLIGRSVFDCKIIYSSIFLSLFETLLLKIQIFIISYKNQSI